MSPKRTAAGLAVVKCLKTKPSGKTTGDAQAAVREAPGLLDLGHGATVEFRPAYFPAAEAARLFIRLREDINWQQREIRIMGKNVLQPRLISYQADGMHCSYTYSKRTVTPESWHDLVLEIKVGGGPLPQAGLIVRPSLLFTDSPSWL